MSNSTAPSAHPPTPGRRARRLPVGAELVADGRVHFRVWAPAVTHVDVELRGARSALSPEGDGYFSGEAEGQAGDRYGFRLDGSDKLYPDPASRYQPDGPHQPSAIVDPSTFRWTDASWSGVTIDGQVIYELHAGTFTPEGTWDAAGRELEGLAALGITIIELMPVAEFDGRFGWGYDGVDLYAPFHGYGTPDDLRRFIDRAHAAGLGVILDVVYNHLGPSGNYLRAFSSDYFTSKYDNEWGDAINFDGERSAPVRELFVENAGYWIDEFHFDGLRLDATQQIFDETPEHIITAIGRRVRAQSRGRSTIVVAENEPQITDLARPVEQGGYGLDGLWNDDFHHSAMVALTGRAEAYYCDTRGTPQELISAAKYGYLFQGQYYNWQRKARGTPARGLAPAQFITYLQNHDQVANSARGLRGHQIGSPARWRALTALLLLMPGTPMLFQGQEFGASAPFLYFADFDGDLGAAIRKGRAEFLHQFPSAASYVASRPFDDPGAITTFERCRLDFQERTTHQEIYNLHRDLLRVRRELMPTVKSIDGAVLGPHAFVLRYFAADQADDHLLVINLGADLGQPSYAEPLLAPVSLRHTWRVNWSSEHPSFGGAGTPDVLPYKGWFIPGDTAMLLAAASLEQRAAGVRRRTA